MRIDLLSFKLLAAPEDIEARVIGNADGDTITMLMDNRPTCLGLARRKPVRRYRHMVHGLGALADDGLCAPRATICVTTLVEEILLGIAFLPSFKGW